MSNSVPKKNLSDQIYEAIRQDILAQNIKFGDRLVNRDLQQRFGVSSTPVRDAINRLYFEGLLDDISRGGARVIQIDWNLALEYNELQGLMNSAAIRISSQKTSFYRIKAALEKSIALQERHKDSNEFYQYDRMFHHAFFEHCGNGQFLKLYDRYGSMWDLLIQVVGYGKPGAFRESAIAQHIEILAAYRAGDIPLAQHHMEQHFFDASLQFKEKFAKK